MGTLEEQIVMTPLKKAPGCTSLLVERQKRVIVENGAGGDTHVAGGAHQGLVIKKREGGAGELSPAQLALEFRVFLVSAQTGKHVKESRTLRFWCSCADEQQATLAQDFFKHLVSPNDFPRDYVGFIKKIMKLLQNGYKGLDKIEVEMRQLGETEEVPERPQSADEGATGKRVELTEERLMEVIEAAYPNPVTLTELAKDRFWDENHLAEMFTDLQTRGLVHALADQPGHFTRAAHSRSDVIQVVKAMPKVVASKQPTIAVVTALYCEKLAVDSMLSDTETYVRFTTVGESNVYTLGTLGCHRVVTTKLPTSGHTREAMTAAGNTTTRLLGTFQQVEYVFLIGVGGGVPHYTDESKHVRLGDVVVSHPGNPPKNYVYCYCDSLSQDENGKCDFETKKWCPKSLELQSLAQQVKDEADSGEEPAWLQHLLASQIQLGGNKDSESSIDFSRPSEDTDKLYMNIGPREVIEVAHPTPSEGSSPRLEGCPRMHLGCVASGRYVAKDESCRQQFTSKYGVIAFDPELDAAVQSVQGNCRDNFMSIRGISDYRDGSRRNEWQPYAALAAASVMKAIVIGMDEPLDNE
ncbi:uncharacterized protein LOC132203739 [Neocloeon triangulifer]|uniref:uncharacterized protein LOC132203739 n=1 Tax=Neocloeon triangulifer TaxID=2078957 RepID=UPI00286F33F2|nr:uncharacterized protein LOC132203739 [Neocloeon triangulifer]